MAGGLPSSAADLLTAIAPDTSNANCSTGYSGYTYVYDLDGRVVQRNTAWLWWYINFGFDVSGGGPMSGGGLDSVYKSLTVTGDPFGAAYQYYYDAFNRRRFKLYPVSGGAAASEEFFYDLGHQMLTSVSSAAISGSSVPLTVDDYVWLGGRPIALIRGTWTSAWVHGNDDMASCARMGDPGKCGIFHIINDYLPKPVMMIEANTNYVTNAALYDEFGHENRIPLVARFSPQPVIPATLGSASLPQGGLVDVRALYNYVDLRAGTQVTIGGGGAVSGVAKAHVWSPWVGNVSSPVNISVTGAGFCGGTRNPPCNNGLQTETLEYRRYSPGATAMWTPIRFPGQYFDEETQFFENWNRYYDPETGRYLSPEPLLFDSQTVVESLKRGSRMPAYTYAGANPVTTIDSDGL
jgi:RHS repeat-associated protein